MNKLEQPALAAAQVSGTNQRPPQLDLLEPFIGRWITEGTTVGQDTEPSRQIHCSDVYEWAVGKRVVLHPVHGRIGDVSVSGLEVISYDQEAGHFVTRFYDSFGTVTSQTLTPENGAWKWQGAKARCTGTFSADGRTLVAQHERSDDGSAWSPSMLVEIRRTD